MAQNESGFKPLLQEVRTPSWDGQHTTVYTLNYVFEYNDHIFDILLSPRTITGYDAEDSIESQYLSRKWRKPASAIVTIKRKLKECFRNRIEWNTRLESKCSRYLKR